jgi:hypothetical protein
VDERGPARGPVQAGGGPGSHGAPDAATTGRATEGERGPLARGSAQAGGGPGSHGAPDAATTGRALRASAGRWRGDQHGWAAAAAPSAWRRETTETTEGDLGPRPGDQYNRAVRRLR